MAYGADTQKQAQLKQRKGGMKHLGVGPKGTGAGAAIRTRPGRSAAGGGPRGQRCCGRWVACKTPPVKTQGWEKQGEGSPRFCQNTWSTEGNWARQGCTGTQAGCRRQGGSEGKDFPLERRRNHFTFLGRKTRWLLLAAGKTGTGGWGQGTGPGPAAGARALAGPEHREENANRQGHPNGA